MDANRSFGVFQAVAGLVGVSIPLGSCIMAVAMIATAAGLLFTDQYRSIGWSLVALSVLLGVLPLGTPWWAERIVQFACLASKEYFALKIVVEDDAAIKSSKPFIIGLEPHSAMPSSMPAVFTSNSPLLPEGLTPCHCLASNVCFSVPIVRHVYWWWGIRAVSKENICRLLQQGRSVVLIPGGVQECLYMQPGQELVFLKRRPGFVRVAMQQGVHLLPVFAFGQSDTFDWQRLGPPLVPTTWVHAISRKMGVVPMLLKGRWGLPIPKPAHMTVVIGTPIEVPHVSNPSKEEVEKYLGLFIRSMQDMYERHKEAAGYGHMQLTVM